MGKKTKKGSEKEEHLGWKLRSPDEVLAQSDYAWNTPDGKAPKMKQCRVQACPETTMRIPPVCDTHFYGLFEQVRNALIQEKAKENGKSNGSI